MDRLWLSLHLPRFPLEVFYRERELSVATAVVVGRRSHLSVAVCDESAATKGVCSGMGLSSACALVPDLHVLQRNEEAEAAALNGLAAWAGQFTSYTSLMSLQGLLLEVGGSLGLFGGLEPLLMAIRRGLEALGYTARLAVAPTPLGSWLLARAGFEQRVMDVQVLPDRLAPVPLEFTELSRQAVETLEGMGLRCFGDCYQLPRDGLARRVGPDLIDFLDRAVGKRPDPRTAYVAPKIFERRLTLPAAVQEKEALLFAARRLLLELAGFLRAQDAGIQSLEVAFFHHNHSNTDLGIELFAPSRDPKHLMDLMRERLEGVELPAAVEHVGLRAQSILPLGPRNQDLFEETNRSLEDRQGLVERLQARLGTQAVRGLDLVADHRPECAWQYATLGVTPSPSASCAPRPLWLLREPKLLKTVGGNPYLGGILDFEAGPERIESGWWDGKDVVRDYFVAQNPQGERFWVFRERRTVRRWFLHGVFG